MFKMLIYMQQWTMVVRSTDRDLLDAAMGAIRRLYSH
jgi:hypothetical protein